MKTNGSTRQSGETMGPPPPLARRGRKLRTPANVRVALASNARRLEAKLLEGEIDEQLFVKISNALTYTLSHLAKVIEGGEVAKRVEQLEQAIARASEVARAGH